ncbi:MAG: cupin domain-containing protein [Halobacteriaceae archaeon]
MRHLDLGEMETRLGPADVTYPLTDALGATDVAVNYYELDPGESFAYGYHAHAEQEEVFYVQSGTVTFRTADGDREVGAGELVRFAPGEYQRGVNEGEERVVALAIGAPQEAGETDIRRHCEECGTDTTQELELVGDREAVVVRCGECGTETDRYGR